MIGHVPLGRRPRGTHHPLEGLPLSTGLGSPRDPSIELEEVYREGKVWTSAPLMVTLNKQRQQTHWLKIPPVSEILLRLSGTNNLVKVTDILFLLLSDAISKRYFDHAQMNTMVLFSKFSFNTISHLHTIQLNQCICSISYRITITVRNNSDNQVIAVFWGEVHFH